MARPLRILYPGAWYHVMNRGLERRKIFQTDADYKSFLSLLKEISALWQIEIHAYCLMPNHYHLLVRTPKPNLPRCMKHLNSIHTQRFNRHHDRDGPLLRGRYKSILVKEENYLVELIRYIHQNPVLTKLARRLEDYRWSSHWAYCSTKNKLTWLHTDFLLDFFGERRGAAITSYRSFIQATIPQPLQQTLDGTRWPAVLGTDFFKDWVDYNFVKGKKEDPNVPQISERKRDVRLQNILRAVADVFDCRVADLRKTVRGQKNEARQMAIYCVWEMMGMAQGKIAKAFKGLTAAGVAKAKQRVKQQLSKNILLQEKLKVIWGRAKIFQN